LPATRAADRLIGPKTSMNLQSIIAAAADEADEFLSGVRSAAEARPAIEEWLSDRHPELGANDRKSVLQGLIALLAREGFFETDSRGANVWGGEDDAAEEE
jgi:hypothetical protein